MSDPITVVIPTRERADTLLYCLETVVAQDSDRLRIVISDNASSPATRDVVESFADPRIAYFNTGERLSMAHNYEFALSKTGPGWIVMVGDDDGLMPGQLEPTVQELEGSGLKALSSHTCGYNWPGAAPGEAVRLNVPLGNKTRVISGREGKAHLLTLRNSRYHLPQTYTGGIIHSSVIDAIRAKRGTFFQSQIPDIFSGFAVCSTQDHFLNVERPFAIAGRSAHSIGAALFGLKKSAFLDEGLIPFHSDFPMPEVGTLTFSMPVIQFESYMQTMYLHGGDPVVSKERMLAVSLANTWHGAEHMPEWGKVYARQHGLDYDAAVRRAKWIRRETKAFNMLHAAERLWKRARVFEGDPRPIANVLEASQTADAILRDPPNRIGETLKALRQRFG